MPYLTTYLNCCRFDFEDQAAEFVEKVNWFAGVLGTQTRFVGSVDFDFDWEFEGATVFDLLAFANAGFRFYFCYVTLILLVLLMVA